MAHRWQKVVVGVVVCVHLLVDVALAAGHVSGWFESSWPDYGFREDLQFFGIFFLPAQFTLLAMWAAWPQQKRTGAAHPVKTPSEVPACTCAVRTTGVVPNSFIVRLGLAAVGVLFIYALLLAGTDDFRRSPVAPVALPTTQVAVIFLGVQIVGRLTGSRQFSLATLLCGITLTALLTGLFRLALFSDVFGDPEAFWALVLMGAYHAVYSLIFLVALYPFGWLVKLMTLPSALILVSLLALSHIWSMSLFITGSWSGVIIAAFVLLSLVQTATVLVTLLILRLCSAFGSAAPRDRPSLDTKFWSWLKGYGRRVLAHRR